MEQYLTALPAAENNLAFGMRFRAAKIAGLAYLITTAIIIVSNFAINARLNIVGNATETARNILSHELLFRLNIVCLLIYCAGTLVLLSALYVVLKPVNPMLALIAALARLLYAFAWAFMALNYYTALRLIGDTGYLKVIETDQLQALAKVFFSGFDSYYVGLLFWSVASTLCAWLWFKSRYIPRVLSAFGLISSVWCVACAVIFLIYPQFSDIVNLWWFDSGMAIFEIVTSFWLVFKGIPFVKVLSSGPS